MFSTTKGRKKLVFGIFWLGFVFFFWLNSFIKNIMVKPTLHCLVSSCIMFSLSQAGRLKAVSYSNSFQESLSWSEAFSITMGCSVFVRSDKVAFASFSGLNFRFFSNFPHAVRLRFCHDPRSWLALQALFLARWQRSVPRSNQSKILCKFIWRNHMKAHLVNVTGSVGFLVAHLWLCQQVASADCKLHHPR